MHLYYKTEQDPKSLILSSYRVSSSVRQLEELVGSTLINMEWPQLAMEITIVENANPVPTELAAIKNRN